MLNLSLRQITEHDLAFLANVYASTRIEELAQTGWPIDQQHSFLQQQFDAQHKHYQRHYPEASFDLILLGGEPVGRLYVSRWNEQIRIVDIALLAEFRGKNIGSQLLRDLFSEARSKGQYVSIHVEKNNPAMGWYKRLGFCAVNGEDKGIYLLMRTPLIETASSKNDVEAIIETTEEGSTEEG